MSYGENIRQIRNSRGLSQQALAMLMGSDQEHISQLEREKKCPRIDTLKRLTDALNCDSIDILGF